MTITDASEPSAKKPRTTKLQKQQLSDAIIVDDYDQTDPEEAAAIVQAREKKKAKSKRLSESMKARWADGRMKGPMAKRAANNAIKKAERLGQTGATVNGKRGQDTEIDADEADEIAAYTNNSAPTSLQHYRQHLVPNAEDAADNLLASNKLPNMARLALGAQEQDFTFGFPQPTSPVLIAPTASIAQPTYVSPYNANTHNSLIEKVLQFNISPKGLVANAAPIIPQDLLSPYSAAYPSTLSAGTASIVKKAVDSQGIQKPLTANTALGTVSDTPSPHSAAYPNTLSNQTTSIVKNAASFQSAPRVFPTMVTWSSVPNVFTPYTPSSYTQAGRGTLLHPGPVPDALCMGLPPSQLYYEPPYGKPTLLGLPRYLRDKISRMVLSSHTGHITLLVNRAGGSPHNKFGIFIVEEHNDGNTDGKITLSLTQTCKQIHKETKDMVWKENALVLWPAEPFGKLMTFSQVLNIRHIQLKFDPLSTQAWNHQALTEFSAWAKQGSLQSATLSIVTRDYVRIKQDQAKQPIDYHVKILKVAGGALKELEKKITFSTFVQTELVNFMIASEGGIKALEQLMFSLAGAFGGELWNNDHFIGCY
jgi:hypothetical protein